MIKKGMIVLAGAFLLAAAIFFFQRFYVEEEGKAYGESNPAKESVLPQASLIFSENPEEENLAGMLQEAASGMMVQVLARESGGSGILYNGDENELTVLTAAHVLGEENESVWVVFADGWAVECQVYEKAADADLAFLSVPVSDIPKEHLETYCRAAVDKESYDSLETGDGVIVMGSYGGPGGNAYEGTLQETWVYLEDFSQYMMLIKAPAVQGMSGGGVFDLNGHFIGLLCGGNENGELAALPLTLIEAEYEEQN